MRAAKSNLARARLSGRMSQEEVAQSLGVSQVTVSLWELGRRPISARRKADLALLLGFEVGALFPEQEKAE